MKLVLGGAALLAAALCSSGASNSAAPLVTGEDSQVTTRGVIEVTARLVEVPEGAIFKRDLYNYATVLKYEAPPKRSAGVRVKTVDELVSKLRDEARVI